MINQSCIFAETLLIDVLSVLCLNLQIFLLIYPTTVMAAGSSILIIIVDLKDFISFCT